jgi:hypothetical protein
MNCQNDDYKCRWRTYKAEHGHEAAERKRIAKARADWYKRRKVIIAKYGVGRR